jgi:hypothetical protein
MQPNNTQFEPRIDLGLRYEEMDLAMNQQGFIGHRVLPILPRNNSSGKFPRVPLDQLMQNLDTRRNPDGTYKRSTREFTNDNYETTEHGLEALLDDRTVKRYDDIIDAEEFEGEVIENSLLMDYEQSVAALIFNTTTFTGRTAGVSTEWSTVASATPVTDIDAKVATIRAAGGIKPNALVINDVVFRNLIRNAQIVDTLKYQGFQDARPGEISRQALAISLNLEEIIVAEGLYNTKGPGVTAVLADIWSSEYALLARVAKTRNPMERCIGRTFMWDEEGATDGERMGVIAETYYENERRGGVLRRRTDWGLKTLNLECGYLFSNITE